MSDELKVWMTIERRYSEGDEPDEYIVWRHVRLPDGEIEASPWDRSRFVWLLRWRWRKSRRDGVTLYDLTGPTIAV